MSDFSIPTDDIDILDFVSSRSQSPIMLPSPQDPEPKAFSAASEPNEKEIASSTVSLEYAAEQCPNVEPGIALDSFLPLLEALGFPGLESVYGIYHLRGSVSEDSFKKLSDCARRVTEFTLNDDGHSSIDPGTWVRLVQLGARYNKSETLFPSLTSLHIDINDADALSLLPLFLAPTLESMEVIDFPDMCLDSFLTFLATLADEAPSLSSITFGRAVQYSAPFHSACMRFASLRELHICNTGPKLTQMTLQDLAHLPELEVLVLNARGAKYSSQLLEANTSYIPQPVSQFPVPSGRDQGKTPLGPEDSSRPKIECSSATSSVDSDNAGTPLVALRGRAPSPSPSIPSAEEPESLTAPTIESINNAEPEKSNAASRKVGFYKLKTLHVVAKVDLMAKIVDLVATPNMVDVSLALIRSPVTPKLGKKVNTTNNDKRLFNIILEKVLASWAHSLRKIAIHYQKTSPDKPHYELSLPFFQSLLKMSSSQSLRHLEISGWTVASNFGDALHYLANLAIPSRLETLHLPIDLGDQGISLNRLRGVVESCPSLTSFQCGFKHLSNVPPCPEDGAVFGLKTLRVGNPIAHDDRRRLMSIAQYLDALFPNLEIIETQEGCNAEQWKEINELVKMCQFSRSHHRRHAKV